MKYKPWRKIFHFLLCAPIIVLVALYLIHQIYKLENSNIWKLAYLKVVGIDAAEAGGLEIEDDLIVSEKIKGDTYSSVNLKNGKEYFLHQLSMCTFGVRENCEHFFQYIDFVGELSDENEGQLMVNVGNITYNKITEMWRDIPVTIEAKVAENDTIPTLFADVEGVVTTVQISVAPELSVHLVGSSELKVEPSEPIKRRISPIAPAPFQWTVTPLRETERATLTLNVYLHLDEGEPHPTEPSYRDDISVRVTGWQRASDYVGVVNPVWAFVVAALPAMWSGYSFFFRGGWRPPNQPPPSPPKPKYAERKIPDKRKRG